MNNVIKKEQDDFYNYLLYSFKDAFCIVGDNDFERSELCNALRSAFYQFSHDFESMNELSYRKEFAEKTIIQWNESDSDTTIATGFISKINNFSRYYIYLVIDDKYTYIDSKISENFKSNISSLFKEVIDQISFKSISNRKLSSLIQCNKLLNDSIYFEFQKIKNPYILISTKKMENTDNYLMIEFLDIEKYNHKIIQNLISRIPENNNLLRIERNEYLFSLIFHQSNHLKFSIGNESSIKTGTYIELMAYFLPHIIGICCAIAGFPIFI